VCFERGSITSCFVPTEEFRLIRLHTRCRRDLTGDRTRDKNRAGEAAGIGRYQDLLGAAGVHGMTGRDIMDHLIAGQRDPKVLAQLARGHARAKIGRLEQALEGADFFTGAHAGLLKAMPGAPAGPGRRSPA
jgi:transposase